MAEFVKAAKVTDVPEGEMKSFNVNGKGVVLCHTAEGFFAVADFCTHDDGPLADGFLDGDQVECPRHGARFSVKTGAVLCLPAVLPIPTFRVKVEGEDILVNVEC